jgi:uncharacterized protein
MNPPLTKTVVLMTKEAVEGNVKTRLASSIGIQNATQIHFELFTSITNLLLVQKIPFVVSIDQRLPNGLVYRYCLDNKIPITLQKSGDLGDKIYYEMNRYPRCVVIGSDTPLLPILEITKALTSEGLFLGPSEDGGFWLIAMTQPHKTLFSDISWSTSSVFSQTLQNAKKLHYPVHFLSKRYDIDTFSDLQKLLSDQNTPSHLIKRILPYA